MWTNKENKDSCYSWHSVTTLCFEIFNKLDNQNWGNFLLAEKSQFKNWKTITKKPDKNLLNLLFVLQEATLSDVVPNEVWYFALLKNCSI